MTDSRNEGQTALQNAFSQDLMQTQALRTAVAHQAEAWAQLQSDVLDHLNEMTLDWMRHRREAIVETQEAINRFAAANDVNALTAAYADWVNGSMTRLAADLGSFAEQSLAISHAVLRTLNDAPGRAAESAEQATRAMVAEQAAPHRPDRTASDA